MGQIEKSKIEFKPNFIYLILFEPVKDYILQIAQKNHVWKVTVIYALKDILKHLEK